MTETYLALEDHRNGTFSELTKSERTSDFARKELVDVDGRARRHRGAEVGNRLTRLVL